MGEPGNGERHRALVDNLLKAITADIDLVCAGTEPVITKESVDTVLNADDVDR